MLLSAGRSLVLGAALSFALISNPGCAADDPGDGQPDKLRDDIPDPAPGGVQLVSPAYTIPPGEEVFICMKYPYKVDEPLLIQSSNVYQSTNGHHVILYYSDNSAGVDPEPHECDGFEMTSIRLITTGTANGTGISTPPGVVMEVPAGVEVWAQAHYINTSDEERLVQDVINLELAEPETVEHVASTFAHVDLTFSLPPGTSTTRTLECEIPHTMTVPWLLPHMHEWGQEFGLELIRKDETEPFWEWSGGWFESARSDFPIQELDEYITLEPGDRIRTTCSWINDTSAPILFPQEMCATFFPYYPGDGTMLACDETGDVFAP